MLKNIAVVDAVGNPQAAADPSEAKKLADDVIDGFGGIRAKLARRYIRQLDRLGRNWLGRNDAGYMSEIDAVARHTNLPGAYILNLAYEVDLLCTCNITEQEGQGPLMQRTLDWGFTTMGSTVLVAERAGMCGNYYDVTWPAMAGSLTVLCPGRFAIALNQAPMDLLYGKRESTAKLFNTLRGLFRSGRTPPLQLVRKICDSARDFDGAIALLRNALVTKECLISLVGPSAGQMARIEIGKNGGVPIVTMGAGAFANDWIVHDPRWLPRPCADGFPNSKEENDLRAAMIQKYKSAPNQTHFGWLEAPILNKYTAIAVEISVRDNSLRLIGFEKEKAVTNELHILNGTAAHATPPANLI